MITSEEEYLATKNKLQFLEKALKSLKQRFIPSKPERFYLMGEGYLKQIEELHDDINEYLGINLYYEKHFDLSIKLSGPRVSFGRTSLRLISKFFDEFLGAVGSIVKYDLEKTSEDIKFIRKAINANTNFRLSSIGKGSLTFNLIRPFEPSLFEGIAEIRPLEKALNQIFETAFWVSSNKPIDEFEDYITDKHLERLLLSKLYKLTPKKMDFIDTIEFRGRLVKTREPVDRVVVSKEFAPRLRRFIGLTFGKEPYDAEGEIREIDLDKRSFTLRNRPDNQPDLRCTYYKHLDEEIFRRFVDHDRVSVTGIPKYGERGNVRRVFVTTIDLSE